MNTVIDDGVELVTVWNGAHNGKDDDLFRRLPETPAPTPDRYDVKRAAQYARSIVSVQTCLVCGTAFEVTNKLTKAEQRIRRFCSRQCWAISRRKASQVAA